MAWWRRKVDLTVMPMSKVDLALSGSVYLVNNASADQHVVSPLELDEVKPLIEQALYANGSQRMLTPIDKGPLGFGILTKIGQRGSYYSDSFARTPFAGSHPATVWLNRIVVAEKSRRRGLGRALLEDLCAKAREMDYTHVGCCIRFCGTDGIAFLKATGFAEVGKFEFRGPYGGVYYFYGKQL